MERNSLDTSKYMKLALHLAKKSYMRGEIPVGAVVVLHGKVVGYGYNLKETLNDATEHAELRALKMAAKTLGTYHLEGTKMYTTLEPCAMCAGAMILFRIDKLIIGAKSPRMGAAGSNLNILDREGLNHKVKVEYSIYGEKCSKLISKFFKNVRRNKNL